MVYKSGSEYQAVQQQPRLAHAIRTMPRWKWKLLSIALVISGIGIAAQAATFLKSPAPSAGPGVVMTSPPLHGNGVSDSGKSYSASPSPSRPVDSAPDAGTPSMPMWKPFMTRVGFSLFVGIVSGVIFRTFLRIALTLTALVILAAGGLSYFHIVNVDLSAVNRETTLFTGWLTDQGYQLRDVLFHALPSSTAAGIGFFVGLKRR